MTRARGDTTSAIFRTRVGRQCRLSAEGKKRRRKNLQIKDQGEMFGVGRHGSNHVMVRWLGRRVITAVKAEYVDVVGDNGRWVNCSNRNRIPSILK